MERLAQLCGVQEQEMRTQRQVEGPVTKWKIRQFSLEVSTFEPSRIVVVQERVHGGHSRFTELFRRANTRPDEVVCVLASLLQDFVVGNSDALPKLIGVVVRNRVSRDNTRTATRGHGIEARRPITTSDDLEAKVLLTQREHAPIFVKGPAPRNDLIEREHRGSIGLAAYRSRRRCGHGAPWMTPNDSHPKNTLTATSTSACRAPASTP